jgi:lysophospholipase L1-like esterase
MCRADGQGDAWQFTGAGIGGNKVYDLYLRMDADVMAKNPDIVVIYIGVNDVWHKTLLGTGTNADKFEKFYQAIIDRLAAQHIKTILCTPAVIGERTDCSNPQDGDLNQYSNIIRSLAIKNKLPVADFRKAFLEYNLIHNTGNKEKGLLTTDRVHLNAAGNQLVADIMWDALKKNG